MGSKSDGEVGGLRRLRVAAGTPSPHPPDVWGLQLGTIPSRQAYLYVSFDTISRVSVGGHDFTAKNSTVHDL